MINKFGYLLGGCVRYKDRQEQRDQQQLQLRPHCDLCDKSINNKCARSVLFVSFKVIDLEQSLDLNEAGRYLRR
jgi:hypothetical protein